MKIAINSLFLGSYTSTGKVSQKNNQAKTDSISFGKKYSSCNSDTFELHNRIQFNGSNPSARKIECSTGKQLGVISPLKELRGIPCPICGERMLTRFEMRRIANDAKNAKSQELQDVLSRNLKHFRGTDRNVVLAVIEQSKKSPEKDLSALIKDTGAVFLPKLYNTNKKILSKILKIKHDHKRSVFKEVQNIVKLGYIFNEKEKNTDSIFMKSYFIKRLRDLSTCVLSREDSSYLRNVIRVASQLPVMHDHEGKIVQHCRNLSNYDSMMFLLELSGVSIDHLIPKNKGGKDDKSNYLMMCQGCNEDKASFSINSVLSPSGSFLQQHVDAVIDKINDGFIPSYQDYPHLLKQTLQKIKKTTYSPSDFVSILDIDISRLRQQKENEN